MKYFLFDGGIENEDVASLIDFLNQNDGDVKVGLCSGGGSSGTARFLLDILNQNRHRITLCAVVGVYSAAFEIFYKFKGKKELTFGAKGMYHYGTIEVRISDAVKPAKGEDRCDFRNMKIYRKERDSFAKMFMNKEELKDFKRNEDIYFDFVRMKEIFSDAEII